jgi:hypothetical protein
MTCSFVSITHNVYDRHARPLIAVLASDVAVLASGVGVLAGDDDGDTS